MPSTPREATLTVPLVGSHFNPPAKQLLQGLPAGTGLTLASEPDNPYDAEAIRVFVDLDGVAPEFHEGLDAALEGTGVTVGDLLGEGPCCLGHVGATGRGPCSKLGLPGTQEVHALVVAEGGGWTLPATLQFDPSGQALVVLEAG